MPPVAWGREACRGTAWEHRAALARRRARRVRGARLRRGLRAGWQDGRIRSCRRRQCVDRSRRRRREPSARAGATGLVAASRVVARRQKPRLRHRHKHLARRPRYRNAGAAHNRRPGARCRKLAAVLVAGRKHDRLLPLPDLLPLHCDLADQQRRNVSAPDLRHDFQARRPTFSPDGTRLALSLANDLVIDLDGNSIVAGGGAYTIWSPHGTYVAYTGGGLWIRNLHTGTVRRLTRRIGAQIAWSSDAKWIAGGLRRSVALVHARDGSHLTKLPASDINGGAAELLARPRRLHAHRRMRHRHRPRGRQERAPAHTSLLTRADRRAGEGRTSPPVRFDWAVQGCLPARWRAGEASRSSRAWAKPLPGAVASARTVVHPGPAARPGA